MLDSTDYRRSTKHPGCVIWPLPGLKESHVLRFVGARPRFVVFNSKNRFYDPYARPDGCDSRCAGWRRPDGLVTNR